MNYLDPDCDYCGMAHWNEHPPRFRPKRCIAALQEELRKAKSQIGGVKYRHRRAEDLERVVRDQHQHILSLEEQLRPQIQRQEVGEQEAML